MNNQAKTMADILISKGLLSTDDIVKGDYQVLDVSRRNQNYRIECGDATGYFVKQVKSANPQALASFQCEAAVHWLAQNDPDFAPLNKLSPQCRGFDPQRNLLVMDLIIGAQTLTTVLQHGLSDYHATQLGQLLAITHWQTGRRTLQASKPSPFGKSVPWILTMHSLQPTQLIGLSEGCRQVISMIQSTPHMCAMLKDVETAWQATTFIHGDLKPDNCLILNDVNEKSSGVQFVDWELADFGDPAWDIAALLQGIWIPGLLQHGVLDKTLSFIYQSQHQTNIILQSYFSASALLPEQWPSMQVRAIQFAAARMVQSAYELLHASSSVTAQALLVLQAASLLYANPQAVASVSGSHS